MERAGERCEACAVFAPYILEVHHVKPVSEGGDGWPDNLIVLCPNYHRYVTKIRGSQGTNKPKLIVSSIRKAHCEELADRIAAIATGRVAYGEDREWHVA